MSRETAVYIVLLSSSSSCVDAVYQTGGKFVLLHSDTQMLLKLPRGEAVTQHAAALSALNLPISTNTDEVIL